MKSDSPKGLSLKQLRESGFMIKPDPGQEAEMLDVGAEAAKKKQYEMLQKIKDEYRKNINDQYKRQLLEKLYQENERNMLESGLLRLV